MRPDGRCHERDHHRRPDRRKLAARFPEARSASGAGDELGQVLIDAGVELRWRDADAALPRPSVRPRRRAPTPGSISRHATAVPPDTPIHRRVDIAAEFERRLAGGRAAAAACWCW